MPFISFTFLSAMARTSNTVLNRSDESGCTCFLPDFRRKVFKLFTTKYDVSFEFVINAVYNIEICSLYTNLDEHLS